MRISAVCSAEQEPGSPAPPREGTAGRERLSRRPSSVGLVRFCPKGQQEIHHRGAIRREWRGTWEAWG